MRKEKFKIDKKSPIPYYQQIVEDIRRKIEKGILKPLQKLPDERTLASWYGVNRITLRRALEILIEEGKLFKVRSKGNFISGNGMMEYTPIVREKPLNTIALLIPRTDFIFFSEIIHGVENYAFKKGYSVLLCNSNDNPQKEKSYLLNSFQNKNIKGIIVAPGKNSAQLISVYKKLFLQNFPLVFIDNILKGLPNINYVLTNNFEGAYNATKIMIEKGCRKIGYIGGLPHIYTENERFKGFKSALSDYKIPIEKDLIVECDYKVEEAFRKMKTLLKKRIDGVFLAGEPFSLGGIKTYHSVENHSLKCLVCFDQINPHYLQGLPVIIVSQPAKQIGYNAAKLLFKLIEKKDVPVTHTFLPPIITVLSAKHK